MNVYLTRSGRKRAYVVAPSRERACELAERLFATPSRDVSASVIDDDLIIDVEAVRNLPPAPFTSLRPPNTR